MICNNKMILLTHIMQHMSRIRTTPPLCAKRRRCGRCGGFFVGSAREEAFSEGAVHARRRTCEGSGTARLGTGAAFCSRASAPQQARTGAVPIVRRRGRGVTPAGACVFSRLRKECRREWSRGWAGIPAHRRPPSLPAARIPRRRSLPGCRGTCRRKWRRCPRR